MIELAAMDTETTGLDTYHGCRPYMVTACTRTRAYVWKGEVDPGTRKVYWSKKELNDLNKFIRECKALVFHNANFDIRMLAAIRLAVIPQAFVKNFSFLPVDSSFNTKYPIIHDTIAASHMVCSGNRKLGHPHGLKELCVKYFGYNNNDELILQRSVLQAREQLKTYADVQIAKTGHPHFPATDAVWEQDMWLDMPNCQIYAIKDVERTLLLHLALQARIQQLNLYPLYHFRIQLLSVLYEMQSNGINVYLNKVDRVLNQLNIEIKQLEELVRTSAKVPYAINLGSPDDLRYLLFNVLKLPVHGTTETGKASTDEATLIHLEKHHSNLPTIRYLMNWKKATKTRSDLISYKAWASEPVDSINPVAKPYPITEDTSEHTVTLPQEIFMPGRLHSTMNLTGTKWTRQSGNDPNPQNFNKKLKFIFGPPKGFYWFYCDVVNIELRIWAYEVNATNLIKEFEAGVSVHLLIAKVLYAEMLEKMGEEAFKETIAYTKCKGGTFARIYGGGVNKVNTTYGVPDACKIIDEKLPEIGAYFAGLNSTMATNAEIFDYPCIFTTQGYKLDVPINAPHSVPSARIQGTAGLVVQRMMIEIVKHPVYKEHSCKLIQQVHDSLTIEIPCHENSKLTNETLLTYLQKVGEKDIKTCPLSMEVIEFHGDDEPMFKDHLFIPEKYKEYSIEMFIHNHKYLCTATYDKETFLEEYASTKDEAYLKILAAIDKEDDIPF